MVGDPSLKKNNLKFDMIIVSKKFNCWLKPNAPPNSLEALLILYSFGTFWASFYVFFYRIFLQLQATIAVLANRKP